MHKHRKEKNFDRLFLDLHRVYFHGEIRAVVLALVSLAKTRLYGHVLIHTWMLLGPKHIIGDKVHTCETEAENHV